MGYRHKKEGALSLLPFLIFIVIYLGAGIYFQIHGVEMAFYQFPSVTAMFIAVLSAFFMGDETLQVKFGIFSRGAGNENVMTMLMIYILAGAFSAVAAAGGVSASAAPVPVYELKGLTVTATRQAETTKDVPANVQIVTEKEIKDRNVQNAAQAVALATGVQVDTTVEGSVNLRGYNSKNILVLVDGQQMNTAWNSTVDWNMIPVENIRKVEVVSGGQSALYGGRAVGGVINIMTKSAKENGVHGAVNLGYGSHNTVKQSYMASGRKDRLNWGVFYESKITDGWRSYLSSYAIKNSKGKNNFTGVDTSSLDTTADGKEYIIGDRGKKEVMSESYGFNLGYDFTEDRKLTYKFTHSNYTWKYTDPRSYLSAGFSKPSGVPASTFFGNRGWRVYDMQSLTYNDQKDKIHAHFGMTDYTKSGYITPDKTVKASRTFDGAGSKTSYPSKSWDFDLNKRWTAGSHTILFGGSYGKDRFDETIWKTVSDWKSWDSAVKGNKDDQWLGGKAKSWALYIQDKWKLSSRWAAYIGGRYDYYEKYGGYNYYRGNAPTRLESDSYHQFSPKLSASYALDDHTNLYLSFGKSFAPPLLYQLYRYAEPSYGGRYEPNPSLKPETTTNWELGIKKDLGKTKISADLFYARTKDYIDLVTIGKTAKGADIKTYKNVGEARTHGAELSVTHKFSSLWSVYANYTWQLGKVADADNGYAMGRDYEIPRHLFHSGVTYTNHPWTVNVDSMFVSARNEPGWKSGKFKSRDAYFLLNMDTAYAVNKNLSVQFSIYNILDREYYDQESASDKYYAGDGRTFTLSARYSF